MQRMIFAWGLALVAALLAGSCGSGGDGGSAATGTLSVTLVDASPAGFSAVYVTVERIDVHRPDGEGWTTALSPGKTINLLELVNGVQEHLGTTELPPGFYNQIRLVLDDSPDGGLNVLGDPHPYPHYFIDDKDPAGIAELIVPSGLRTGVKLVGGLTIASGETTHIVLDFDAADSVVMAGQSGKNLLKPVIKVLESALEVHGTVTDPGLEPLSGVLVTAQRTDPGAPDESDRVVVAASTLTDAGGGYTLFLNPGTYNLVAYRGAEPIASVLTAYGPECVNVEITSPAMASEDFSLSPDTLIGEVEGTVVIAGAPPDQHAALSFRQTPATCGENIEVLSLNIANGGTYNSIYLPAGPYRLVGATEGKPSTGVNLTVIYNSVATGDVNFP